MAHFHLIQNWQKQHPCSIGWLACHFYQKWNKNQKLVETVFYRFWHICTLLASFPGCPPEWQRRKVRRRRAWYRFAHDAHHINVTALMAYSVMSPLEGANFCVSNRSIERRLYWWQRQWRHLVIQAARDTKTVQYKYRTQLTHSKLSSDENFVPPNWRMPSTA